jgi:serine protease Do
LLGIRSGPVTEQTRVRLGVPQAGGALVVARVVGSPADRAGIPLDSVIVAFDGRPIGSPTDLARFVSAAGAGKEVEIDYYIGSERRKATVTLANAPQTARPANPAPGPDPISAPRPLELDPQETQAPQARIEQLERQLRELEQRVQELERALRTLQPEAPPRQQQ